MNDATRLPASKTFTPGGFPHLSEPLEEVEDAPLSSPWLSGAVEHCKIQNYSPSQWLSVNSLDIESEHLVCATDNEVLLVVPNLTLR